MKLLVLIISLSILVVSFKNEPACFVQPRLWPKPVYDFSKHPLSPAQIELGRALFYDPILSANNTISCASCHSPYNAFAHADHALSHGIYDSLGKRNAPALMNLAWHKNFMWDGAIHNLEFQALAPISNTIEMNESIAHVVVKLQEKKMYRNLFAKAFRDSVITGEGTLLALTQFLLSLESYQSKYDSVQGGTTKFTEQEQHGYQVFKKNCNKCHTEPLFSNFEMASNGLAPDSKLKDYGRMGITNRHQDSLQFKTPTLRNIEFSYPYMHDGRFNTLYQVVQHYSEGIQQKHKIPNIPPGGFHFNDREKTDLVAFLLTLSDRQFIFNKKHQYPKHILP